MELERVARELNTAQWIDALEQAAEMGILQVHFSGGEPAVREDLEEIIAAACKLGLYSNLITSAMRIDEARMAEFSKLGLDHVQISIQDSEERNAHRISGSRDGFRQKLRLAGAVVSNGLPLTVNAPIHRMNIGNLESIIDLALEMRASRLEVAHVQYYGWAYHNRAALMPRRDQLAKATWIVEKARARLEGILVIDYVVPDYYAHRPKACMNGWGRQFLNVTPSGKVLPCHAAESITSLRFDSLGERRLRDIWEHSEAFEKYRGSDWMPAKCQTCERREVDWSGCRCQAFAVTGAAENMDPACEFSEHHERFVNMAIRESEQGDETFDYRRIGFKIPVTSVSSRPRSRR